MPKDETAITAACIQAINASGLAFVWRQGSGVVPTRRGWCHLGPKGIPDIVGWLKGGRFVAIETKTPSAAPKARKDGKGVTAGTTKKSRAEAQAEWRERILEGGGAHAQCLSVDEAIAFVKCLSPSPRT